VRFSLKIGHLVAPILLIFLRIKTEVHFTFTESWDNVNIQILVCQIIGTAAAGSAGSVPSPHSPMNILYAKKATAIT